MSNFVLITLSDSDYARPLQEAAQYMASILPSARVSKDSIIVATVSQYLQHRLVDERYIDSGEIHRAVAKLSRHLQDCVTVTDHKVMPMPTNHDVQVVIDLHTKHVHYQ